MTTTSFPPWPSDIVRADISLTLIVRSPGAAVSCRAVPLVALVQCGYAAKAAGAPTACYPDRHGL